MPTSDPLPPSPHRITGIPESCDCVWSIYDLPNGCQTGAIFIASEKCMRHLMHPRTFTTSEGRS